MKTRNQIEAELKHTEKQLNKARNSKFNEYFTEILCKAKIDALIWVLKTPETCGNRNDRCPKVCPDSCQCYHLKA